MTLRKIMASNKKQFSVFFVKFSICFLLMGLAYRIFSSSTMQFSPLEVSDKGLLPENTFPSPESANFTVKVMDPSSKNGWFINLTYYQKKKDS